MQVLPRFQPSISTPHQVPPPVALPVASPAVSSSAAQETSEWRKPAPYFSFFALCVSIGGVVYTYRKDSRARKHSIEDDYWLRKVIGPIAIEPLLKGILEMIAAAPSDSSMATYSAEVTKEFHDVQLKKLADLAVTRFRIAASQL